ncbi:TlpA family protein disulfide reductase [uncultured Amnibacterium sp.]|uniref:TlpA family protein disulfide reductase n=1 Tax=uncultured Amnibacterium sp. TaxID=1631851 RepID=UPI0035C9BCFD
MRRGRLLAGGVAALLLLTGCTEAGAQGTTSGPGYISGDGTITEWEHPTTDPVAFSGTTVENTSFSSEDHLGQVVVVNFWYAGCPPCRKEAPTLNTLADAFKSDGVQFVGVNVSDDRGTAAGFERTYRSAYPSIVDQEQGAAVQLAFAANRSPKAVPSTLVLDRKGRVVARVVGGADESILTTLIQDAVDGQAA